MNSLSTEAEDQTEEYYVVPEEAFQFLPKEWRDQLQTMADDGRAIFKTVDKELSQLSKISNSLSSLVALKHIQKRLFEYRFAADMDAILELEMLTTAFVVTYTRLQQGGSGSGFSRDSLPAEFREVHDNIIGLRNKRFAHNEIHDSVSNAMEIGFQNNCFEVSFQLTLGYHIGGDPKWQELVDFLDHLIAEKLEKVIKRLKERTGHDWSLPSEPK